MTGQTPHPSWCARDHRCAVRFGEHAAEPIVIDVPGHARGVLSRVQVDGRDHADIRIRIALPDHEPHARLRLTALLTHLRTLIGPVSDNNRKRA